MTDLTSPSRLRLFVDAPCDGPTNMAIDDCLLAAIAAGAAPALRLYRWREPTLSLGYFQSFADPARSRPEIAALPVVRRVTGGGAILHADELTYSMALPIDHPLVGDQPARLYTWMHDRIAEATAALGGATAPKGGDRPLSGRGGPFLCFRRHAPFDLMADGEKLAGSAQRRTRRGVLQHGSVILSRTHPVQPSASISETVGGAVGFDEFAEALIAAVTTAGVSMDGATPTPVDAGELATHRNRHADDAWLRRR